LEIAAAAAAAAAATATATATATASNNSNLVDAFLIINNVTFQDKLWKVFCQPTVTIVNNICRRKNW
jgi:hypothetical protein